MSFEPGYAHYSEVLAERNDHQGLRNQPGVVIVHYRFNDDRRILAATSLLETITKERSLFFMEHAFVEQHEEAIDIYYRALHDAARVEVELKFLQLKHYKDSRYGFVNSDVFVELKNAVVCNWHYYPSIADAAAELQLSVVKVKERLAHPERHYGYFPLSIAIAIGKQEKEKAREEMLNTRGRDLPLRYCVHHPWRKASDFNYTPPFQCVHCHQDRATSFSIRKPLAGALSHLLAFYLDAIDNKIDKAKWDIDELERSAVMAFLNSPAFRRKDFITHANSIETKPIELLRNHFQISFLTAEDLFSIHTPDVINILDTVSPILAQSKYKEIIDYIKDFHELSALVLKRQLTPKQ